MKKLIFFASLIYSLSLFAQQAEYEHDYMFFENSLMSGSYYYSSTSCRGGSYINNIQGKIPVSDEHAFTAPNSLMLDFSKGDGNWEAKILFEKVRGNDFFKESHHLSFWFYPDNTGEELYPDISIGPGNEAKSSEKLSFVPYIEKRKKGGWIFVKIPLEVFGIKDAEPGEIVFSGNQVPGNGRIFIDQVELYPMMEAAEGIAPPDITARGYERHVDITWPHIADARVKYLKIYRSEDQVNYRPVGIQRPYYDRFTDYTGESGKTYHYRVSLLDYAYNESRQSQTAGASTRTFSDEELMDMVQEASFRYYWEGAEPNSGLARENIPGRKNMIATGASGFGIMAIIVGVERGFITRDQAVQRMKKIVSFLGGCDTYHGAVSHFIDGPTGKTTAFFGKYDNGGDLVETSFLYQGLLTARAYFDAKEKAEKEIRNGITCLWEAVEWDWYDREKENKFLTWHWSPDYEWHIDHKLIGWNETMITYILAMASPTHPVDPAMYYNGWASQEERAREYRSAWGKTPDGSEYTNGNYYHGIKLDVGVANGGPLFFVHYSFLGMDPRRITDSYTNYFENNRNIALINWRYCSENPNKRRAVSGEFWGFTASDGPWGYRALEPLKEKENGTMAPTGSLASFPYTPEQSMGALKHMYREHGKYLWGEYGFRDAVNLDENWQARIYMGLNQAPVVIMIENYRSGLIWELFMKNQEVAEVLKNLKESE